MRNKKDIIDYEFGGWPIYKMSLCEILKDLGAVEIDGNLIFTNSKSLEQIYPIVVTDDGSGYGVDEQFVSSVSRIDDKVILFRNREINNIELWESGQFKPYDIVTIIDSSPDVFIVKDIKKEGGYLYYFCTNYDDDRENLWIKSDLLTFVKN